MRPGIGPYQELVPLLDHGLASQVRRVRLTRQHQLNGTVPIRQDACQTLGIMQQKIGPLVSSEAPGKSHSQGVEVEDPLCRLHLFGRRSPASEFARQALARVFDQSSRSAGSQLPQIGIGNRPQVLGDFRGLASAVRSDPQARAHKASLAGDSQVPT